MAEPSAFPNRSCRPFKRLTVDAHFNPIVKRRILVDWALSKEFDAPGPYTVTLQRGYATNDDSFIDVAVTVDQPWLYDNSPAWPGKGLDVFYRVKLVDGEGREYVSQPASAGSHWSRYDWTIAKEIIRKEHLVLRKRAGVKGWLLKRRLWGDICAACADPETGQINEPNCTNCYGTGIDGGYYDPLEYWVIMNPTQRLKKLDAQQGLKTQTIETVRSLAYPRPVGADVWVNAYTDQRYVVMGDVAATARHRGVDLVLNLRLEERDRSEPMYLVPVPCV